MKIQSKPFFPLPEAQQITLINMGLSLIHCHQPSRRVYISSKSGNSSKKYQSREALLGAPYAWDNSPFNLVALNNELTEKSKRKLSLILEGG